MSEQSSEDRDQRVMEAVCLAAIMLIALVLRLRHIDTLLPWFFYEDELRTTQVSLDLLKNRTIDPHYDFYPALGFYVNAAAYYLWALAGRLGDFFSRGPGAVLDYLGGIRADDLVIISVSRHVSLVFGLATLPVFHLLAKFYLSFRWALAATLLVALNPVHVSISSLGKVDAIAVFWFMVCVWASVWFFRKGSTRALILAAAGAGLYLVTKSNFIPCITVVVTIYLYELREGRGVLGALMSWRIWLGVSLILASAFIGSPYSFIRFQASLENIGWLYLQAEIMSTYHTDPHVWWLDRYHYLWSVILPFVYGFPVFWLMVAGVIHHAMKWARNDCVVFINLVWFLYYYASQAGGKTGGAFAYYLFLITLPLGILVGAGLIEGLAASNRTWVRRLGVLVFGLVFFWSLFGVDNQQRMFFSGYDELGPWLSERTSKDARVLMISVYKPGPGLGIGGDRIKSVWPHKFDQELIDSFDPDVVVVDTWIVAGFRKVYRDQWVAPLVDSFLSGERGYREAARFKVDYLGRSYFAAIDVEHDVEIIVVARPGAVMNSP